jgi:hypothetical protein
LIAIQDLGNAVFLGVGCGLGLVARSHGLYDDLGMLLGVRYQGHGTAPLSMLISDSYWHEEPPMCETTNSRNVGRAQDAKLDSIIGLWCRRRRAEQSPVA